MKQYVLKFLIPVIALMLGFSGMAQYHGFVRIFDLQGKKIYKGRVISITDSSLTLKDNVTFMATEIGMIKTKRSAGHNIGLGAAIGAVISASIFIGLVSNNGPIDDGAVIVGALGIVLAPIIGTVAGFISVAIKNPQTFEINGNLENWQTFKQYYLKKYWKNK